MVFTNGEVGVRTMARDFLNHIDVLDGAKFQEDSQKLQDEVLCHLQLCDPILQAEILHTFVQKVVTYSTQSEAESFFKILLPAAASTCHSAFKTLQSWKSITEIQDLLQACVSVLKCLSGCIRGIKEQQWRSLPLLTNILKSAFQLLKAVYTHCQDSARMYGSVTVSVNGSVTLLFREAASMQDCAHSLADWLLLQDDLTPSRLTLFTSVCDDIAQLARLLTPLDARAMAEAWRCWLRLLEQQPRLATSCRLPAALTFMADTVTDRLAHIRQLATAPADGGRPLSKAVKLAAFYLKLVVLLTETYPAATRPVYPQLTRLVLTLWRFSAPDSHVTGLDAAAVSQLSSQLTVAAEPLLFSLMQDEAYHMRFWPEVDAASAAPVEPLCRLRCCLAVARRCCRLTADARAGWTCGSEYGLLDTTLRLLHLCDAELTTAVPMESDLPDRIRVSLYEQTVVSLCALVGSLTAEEFSKAERCLWRHVCCSGLWSSLVASDVLCFIARYGPADLCLAHCRAAAAALDRRRCPALSRLLRRLLPLLATEHRCALLLRPPAPASALLRAGCPTDGDELMRTALSELPPPGPLTTPQLRDLTDTLSAACSASLPESQVAPLLAVVEELGPRLAAAESGPAGRRLSAALLTAAAAVSHWLTDKRLIQTLQLASDRLGGGDVPLKLAVVRLLASLSLAQLSDRPGPDLESAAVLLVGLFRSLLADDSRLVRQRTLEVLAGFARDTPRPELVLAVVAGRPADRLQGRVSAYLKLLAGRPPGAAALSARLVAHGRRRTEPPAGEVNGRGVGEVSDRDMGGVNGRGVEEVSSRDMGGVNGRRVREVNGRGVGEVSSRDMGGVNGRGVEEVSSRDMGGVNGRRVGEVNGRGVGELSSRDMGGVNDRDTGEVNGGQVGQMNSGRLEEVQDARVGVNGRLVGMMNGGLTEMNAAAEGEVNDGMVVDMNGVVDGGVEDGVEYYIAAATMAASCDGEVGMGRPDSGRPVAGTSVPVGPAHHPPPQQPRHIGHMDLLTDMDAEFAAQCEPVVAGAESDAHTGADTGVQQAAAVIARIQRQLRQLSDAGALCSSADDGRVLRVLTDMEASLATVCPLTPRPL